MAESLINPGGNPKDSKPWQLGVEEAREMAKARFRERLSNGEHVGGCSCSTEDEPVPEGTDGPRVVGVRFRDSGRVYFFDAAGTSVDVGTWVVCTTSWGQEAARVVVAPKQVVMSQLDGDLKPIDRVLSVDDVQQIEERRRDAARVVRRGGEISRAYDFGIKVIAAEYSLDGRHVRVSCSASDHSFVEDLGGMLSEELGVEVEMQMVGPRDEARLIGGLGKCGRTLCCSSWLPIYPDVSMGMAKNQDLSLNPTKVTGLCGRLLCCLSYENEQYKKARQLLPRLGQRISTPDGDGMVVSLQVLKELVTVRFDDSHRQETYPASELLAPGKRQARVEPAPVQVEAQPEANASNEENSSQPRRRRRRRRRNRSENVGA